MAGVLLPGPQAKGWPGRERDLAAHLDRLRPEFGQRSAAAHLLASVIVVLRRDPGDTHAQALFTRLTTELGDRLAPEISLRWLISVCDTVADLPASALAERALAMMGAGLANLVKLAETERRIYYPPRPWPPVGRFDIGHEMFDGLKAYWPERGDMVSNLLDRLAGVLDDPEAARLPVTPFVVEILLRLTSAETVIGRFEALRGQARLPQVSDDLRRRLASLMSKI